MILVKNRDVPERVYPDMEQVIAKVLDIDVFLQESLLTGAPIPIDEVNAMSELIQEIADVNLDLWNKVYERWADTNGQ